MWSDSLAADRLAHAIAVIRSAASPAFPARAATVTPIASPATPEQVARLLHAEPGFVWLDGGAGSRHLFFANPVATIRSAETSATITGPGGIHHLTIPSLDFLDAALRAWQGIDSAILAGFLSYDIAAELEDLGSVPPISHGLPRLQFGLYSSALVFDSTGWSLLASPAWLGDHGAARRLAEVRELLCRAKTVGVDPPGTSWPSMNPPAANDEAFLTGVETTVQRIHRGDFFQTNLCRNLDAPFPAEHAWPLYLRMRAANPSRYGAFLSLDPGTSILSMSPELFLRNETGLVETHPIKGTRTRIGHEPADRAALSSLVDSPKDAAELAMIVDVARNDLSRVCTPGSVRVLAHRSVLELPSLFHTWSRVAGRLAPENGPAALLRASFPPASITGAPKIAAIQAALEIEGQGRGPCMGSIGWISPDGRLELSVAIRTAFTHRGRIHYLSGCGITADSDPASELEESRAKAAAFLSALG